MKVNYLTKIEFIELFNNRDFINKPEEEITIYNDEYIYKFAHYHDLTAVLCFKHSQEKYISGKRINLADAETYDGFIEKLYSFYIN